MMKFWQIIVVLLAVLAVIAFFSLKPPREDDLDGLVPFTMADLANNGPSVGDANAKVTIVEFSDYQCPACLVAEQSIRQVLPAYEGKVRFVYRNFPLYNIHPNTGIAAEAALAAGEQGKFWQMHNALFENQQEIAKSGIVAIKAIAKQLGLDEAQFNEALDSNKFKQAVKNDFDDAVKFGCEGTPTFFINGQKYFAALSPAQLKQIIDTELVK